LNILEAECIIILLIRDCLFDLINVTSEILPLRRKEMNNMKYFDIIADGGQTIRVSRIIMGGGPLGTNVSRENSFRMMDKFVERGGNAIDTARVYCDWLENGHNVSEQTIGEWIKERGNRKDIVLITKGGHPPIEQINVSRLSRKEIIDDMETSLKILQVDYVDIYFLHRDDVSIPVGDIMDTLHELVQQGKTRALGVSNWSADRIFEANAYAREHKKTQLCVSEIQWSLAECTPENLNDKTVICMTKAEYEKYLEIGIPVFAFSSQAYGLFSKATDDLNAVGEKLQRFVTPENIRRYGNLLQYCRESGYSKTAVSLGYIIGNRLEAAAIIGCSNMSQLEDSLSAADITLNQAAIEGLTR
jgi:aryl-alcohol dehydrogenase-like predicted oxidoreductase